MFVLSVGRAVRNAGVVVREDLYKGLPDGFWFFNNLSEWSSFVDSAATVIRWIVEGPSDTD